MEQNASEARQIMIQIDEMIESTLESLLDEITEEKKEISKYHQLAFKHRFSLSFIASFEDAFQCSICQQTPARPPLIACSACSTLVGCETCTNEWYRESSLGKRCPKCRSERGLAKTFVLRSFDEVVTQIRQPHEDGNDNESRTLVDTLPVVAPE